MTGGAGFVGQRLVQRLVDEGHGVRILIRPSAATPRLPQGLSVQAAISSLADLRGLRAALVGVERIFHLAGVDWLDSRESFRATETEGTRNLLEAAQDAGIKRFVFLSHLGADRAAAFAPLKAKGIAEEFVRRSSLPYTIIRSSLTFGPGDHFTTDLAKLMAFSKVFPLPLNGRIMLQPFWVEDLVTCLTWCLDDEATLAQTIEVGGPEHLSLRRISELIQQKAGLQSRLISGRPSYLRILINLTHAVFPRLPASNFWLDYLAADRICELDTVPRVFHLLAARFSQKVDYLAGVDWRQALLWDMATHQAPAFQID
ncbi:MAG: NAD(P)H-binding protein [Anaerolineales bacterium]